MIGRRWVVCALALLELSTTRPAGAQSLRSRFIELFIFGQCGQPLCLDGPIRDGTGHGLHYVPAAGTRSLVAIQALQGDLSSSIATAVSNISLGTGSGGASFSFVEGLPVTNPVSAGPILGERGQTLGRHQMQLGVSVTGGKFNRLRGVPLRSVQINFTHEDIGNPGLGDPFFERDVLTVQPDLSFTLLAASLGLTYGLTENLDVGVVAPLIHASLSGRSIGQIPCPQGPCFHYFEGTASDPQLVDTSTIRGSATGIGDVALRAKWGLTQTRRVALALLAEVRLPTGREEDFLGSGHTAFKFIGVGSTTWGTFTAHANAGYFARGGSDQKDAILGTLGFDNLIGQSVTLAADLVTQWQIGENPFPLPRPAVFISPSVYEVPLMNVPNLRDNRIDGSFGLKVTNGRGLSAVANAQFPLRAAGLQASLIWTLGAQYNF